MVAQAQKRKQILRMKAERLKRGWRLEDLAHFSRMSSADISRIENRRLIPYPSYIARLAKALRLKPEQLLEEVDG